MTGYHNVPRQSSFFHINSDLDPWLIQSSNEWDKTATTPPSLFDPDDEQQDWSPPVTPPDSPPNISAIKKSLIQAQQFLSTASPIDPWTVSQPNPIPTHNASKSKKKKDGNIEEEITQQNLYKTELCRSFMETNTCRYGVKCQFAHGRHEQRPVMRHPKYKTEICKTFHTLGTCPYGIRCRFIHTRPKDATDPSSSSAESSAFSSPSFTPPDSPSLSSTSPPELLQWSTSWTSLDAQRSLPPSPQEDAKQAPQPAQVPDSPPEDELTPARRLPIFRDIAIC
jgi:hypothetical protein